ncbi:TPA: hypothetical protein DDW69_04410 [candidate division CPR2 bacterium]|uniref:Putative membrane protein n=1 Tax=candidate division CPR2 bacterium GW2011_GWC1_41_48 TaxID=1618344 RepID=A0A0G0W8H6_UNCC2|nr:MAG: putative membrane protein [candidate division CPR2 bacterium GW2011_GWC2_39_35]KKR27481.1 MAG: putative membrane protein [candidate division CPR2 bacterium GW2011_GWD1_39_7]KKR29096.1 MAG: putative membrane protein [candidate division CPR2 bacterium GW2011_GWD2_39_7]KKS09289.1 MAG: putative membrane protein [candidate division CPR2 bacterium GW2011_GWC1_41_48]OGB58900.1 MAG: hypothetical protein A2Y27_03140 [candidate division CPR2 bacterium GWD1_39_7]OGB70583.1 MAG: hypothetical prote
MNTALGILFGLMSMLSYGLSNAISKVPAKKDGSQKLLFYRNVFISILLLLVFLLSNHENIFLDPQTIITTILVSSLGAIPLIALYQSLKLGKVGVVTPITGSSAIFTIILALIFFKETLNTIQVIAVFLIVLGNILISINFKEIKKSHLFSYSSGVPLAVAGSLGLGAYFFLIKIPINTFGPILAALLVETGVAIGAAVYILATNRSFSLSDKSSMKYIFFVAILAGFGGLVYNYGVRVAPVSLVTAVGSARPMVSIIYGKLVYKEKLQTKQYLAGLIIVSGLIIISL